MLQAILNFRVTDFGLSKREYKKTDYVEDFARVIDIIKKSSKTNVIVPLRDPTTNKRSIEVYDWKTFLAKKYNQCESSLKIFTLHYFCFKKTNEYRDLRDTKFENIENSMKS